MAKVKFLKKGEKSIKRSSSLLKYKIIIVLQGLVNILLLFNNYK